MEINLADEEKKWADYLEEKRLIDFLINRFSFPKRILFALFFPAFIIALFVLIRRDLEGIVISFVAFLVTELMLSFQSNYLHKSQKILRKIVAKSGLNYSKFRPSENPPIKVKIEIDLTAEEKKFIDNLEDYNLIKIGGFSYRVSLQKLEQFLILCIFVVAVRVCVSQMAAETVGFDCNVISMVALMVLMLFSALFSNSFEMILRVIKRFQASGIHLGVDLII